MNIEDIATVMVLCPDLLPEDDILMLLLAECEQSEVPLHYKYKRFSFDRLSETEFKQYFRFTKEHVALLVDTLKLKQTYTASSKLRWSGTEGLCILLRRLCYPNRLCDLVPLFGRHETELSVIVNVMLYEVCRLHLHRLTNVNSPWIDHVAFAEAVTNKGCPMNNIWGFLDGTQGRLCRPQQGQESIFNGHKRIHSLKYQGLMVPNGLVAHFFGPIEGRRHDSAMYHLSGLDAQIDNIFGNGQQLAVYGDSAYAFRRYLITPFKGANLAQIQTDFNKEMSRLRICVEWGFGNITNMFAFLSYHKNQKVYLQPVAKYWIAAVLFYNCHCCLYGSQTSTYFGLNAPSIEEYLA